MIGQSVALLGAVLVMIAGIGVVRFDDAMSRLHALTKASTLGVVLVLVGAAVVLDRPNDWTSLLLAAALQLATSPLSAALIGRSTYLVTTDDPEEDLDGAVTAPPEGDADEPV